MSEPQRQAEDAAQHDQGAADTCHGLVAVRDHVRPGVREQRSIQPVAQHAAQCDQAAFIEDDGQLGRGDDGQAEQQGDGDQCPEGHTGRAGTPLRCGGSHWDTRGEWMVARNAARC